MKPETKKLIEDEIKKVTDHFHQRLVSFDDVLTYITEDCYNLGVKEEKKRSEKLVGMINYAIQTFNSGTTCDDILFKMTEAIEEYEASDEQALAGVAKELG